MEHFSNTICSIQEFLWNFPMLILLFGTHLFFTFRLHGIQRYIPKGIRLSFAKQSGASGTITPYAALATALAATIGTGNIIGISTAIAIGGPGAIFWCWLTGVFGIATCYSECFLSVKYRVKNEDGSYSGGPMYLLKNVLHKKWLAILFAIFTILASMGIGSSVQSHSIRSALEEQITISPHIIGIIVSLLAGLVIIGGVKQISKVCTFLVPFMSFFYLFGCFYLLILNRAYILSAIVLIVKSAFSADSLAGGVAGTLVMTGMRVGISRGLFTNEAGLGSIPMAAATAKTSSPVRQGLVSMTGAFWDTVVICAITGIVIVCGMIKNPNTYITLAPDRLCFAAFQEIPKIGNIMLSISLVLFAFATIIGWCFYGECGVRFLRGESGLKTYKIAYMVFIYLGAVMPLEIVWNLSDLFNSFMAIPNIICLWLLQKVIHDETIKQVKGLSH